MGLAGGGVLAIWNGIADEAEADFLSWHVREHIPERVAVPGFLRGRRYVAVRGEPKYFNFYETDTPAALSSPAYIERLNAPSEWTKRVVRHFRQTSRTACSLVYSAGEGDGAFVATLRMATRAAPEEFLGRLTAGLENLRDQRGVVGVHLLRGEAGSDGGATAEKALRGEPDQTAAWILLAEATNPEPLEAILTGELDVLLGTVEATCPPEDRGIYRLQYSLGREQLSGPSLRR
ncbi:hypothetical protein Sa4125_40290 [Aureimonas sp. SA4125]|uniref:DUF4286 family protein n=1 Tax=Aureimonas sp. SA4125 TaxID=2826993 RepID=UPI001CC3D011|nr:DUF4286 family protein [Aureimonas sp. SA4125]BDA86487.1 hypothetical protein Sa4125_40290 [Aureimonas sp. SA4125]